VRGEGCCHNIAQPARVLLVIVAISLGTVGVVVKSFLYLLITGVLILIANLIMAGVRFRRSGRSPGR
jgi:hypothetical protein